MELVHILVILALVVIVLVGLILFRINTHIQMRVSFNMDDECNIYNQRGLVIFIKKHKRKLTNPTLVVVDIKNLMMVYKLQEEKKEFMIKVSDLMLRGLKSEETLARLAFNKFCILYNDRKREEIQELGKEFDKNINAPSFEYNLDIQFRIAFGVYEKPILKDVTFDLRDAEASIRHSKIKDKNFYYFSPDVTNYLIKRDTINASKKGAYEEKRIISYIQPKVSLKTGRVCGGEILCRWVDEQYKPIYFPDEFIPVFEENGFVKQVDMLMLNNACQLVQTLLRRGNEDVVISVNLSKANFESENCIQKILDVVNLYEVPHQNIEFEVTETAIMNSPAYVSDAIMKIRQLGFKVAMDDFGKEYSSLGSLSDNPYDTIKLDGIFFKNSLSVDKERHIAENLITMLSKLNVEIVCEGVEDRETVDYIGSICDECVIQGYVFSKPIPLNQFEAFLDTQYEFDFEPLEVAKTTITSKGIRKVSKDSSSELDDQRVRELEARINQMQQELAKQQALQESQQQALYQSQQEAMALRQSQEEALRRSQEQAQKAEEEKVEKPQKPAQPTQQEQPYPQQGQPYYGYGQPYPQQGQPYYGYGQPYPGQGQGQPYPQQGQGQPQYYGGPYPQQGQPQYYGGPYPQQGQPYYGYGAPYPGQAPYGYGQPQQEAPKEKPKPTVIKVTTVKKSTKAKKEDSEEKPKAKAKPKKDADEPKLDNLPNEEQPVDNQAANSSSTETNN